MKSLLSILFVFAMALGPCGCSDSSSAAPPIDEERIKESQIDQEKAKRGVPQPNG